MKLTDLAIVFFIIILPFYLIMDINTKNAEINIYKRIEINRMLDTAVEDGVSELVESGGDKSVVINKEKAVKAFFKSLQINLNVLDDEIGQKRLEGYIPCILIVDYDGYYVLSNQEYDGANGKETKMIWSPKQFYSYYDKNTGYVYNFTLGEYLSVFHKNDNTNNAEFYEGVVNEVNTKINSEILSDTNMFQQIRRRTIVNGIKREINDTINNHNSIARDFGITYNFTLPTISNEDWYKTIDDVGMLVFFQGMPIGITGEAYNNFALGGSRIVKKAKYYLEEDASGFKFYHKIKDCQCFEAPPQATMDSREQCSKSGYMPCKICRP